MTYGLAFGRCVAKPLQMPVREKRLLQQGIRQLFSAGKDCEATEILVDHIMLVSPGADRKSIFSGRNFGESGKLQYWTTGA